MSELSASRQVGGSYLTKKTTLITYEISYEHGTHQHHIKYVTITN